MVFGASKIGSLLLAELRCSPLEDLAVLAVQRPRWTMGFCRSEDFIEEYALKHMGHVQHSLQGGYLGLYKVRTKGLLGCIPGASTIWRF